jgi:hypothetical protein
MIKFVILSSLSLFVSAGYVTNSYAQDVNLRPIVNTMASDAARCIAYYQVVRQCFVESKNAVKHQTMIEKMTKNLNSLGEIAVIYADQAALAGGELKERVETSYADITKEINSNCANVPDVMKKSEHFCKMVREDLIAHYNFWATKISSQNAKSNNENMSETQNSNPPMSIDKTKPIKRQ